LGSTENSSLLALHFNPNVCLRAGGLLLFVADTSAFEEVDKTSGNIGAESPTNLLSSGFYYYLYS